MGNDGVKVGNGNNIWGYLKVGGFEAVFFNTFKRCGISKGRCFLKIRTSKILFLDSDAYKSPEPIGYGKLVLIVNAVLKVEKG